MIACGQVAGAIAALALAAPGPHGDAGLAWRSGEMVPHLEVRVRLDGADERQLALPDGPSARRGEGPPPCVNGVCQPRVAVPGFEAGFGRPHRTELVASLLERAGIEPFATIAWLFATTGFRLDWSPPTFDGSTPATAQGGGWGSVFVRLRLRIDPMNHPVFPHRRPDAPRRSWAALVTPQA
jgi:hypothetical protein